MLVFKCDVCTYSIKRHGLGDGHARGIEYIQWCRNRGPWPKEQANILKNFSLEQTGNIEMQVATVKNRYLPSHNDHGE